MTDEQQEHLRLIRQRYQLTTFAFKNQVPPQAMSDIGFLLSILEENANQQSVGERCVECDHSGPWDENGRCLFDIGPYVDPEGPAHYQKECFCHCTFPSAPEAQSAGDYSQYEDQLPPDIPKADYDRWFALSKVIDGVRVGPKYPFQSAGERISELVVREWISSLRFGHLPPGKISDLTQRINAAISKAQVDTWAAGMRDAAKEVCDACDNEQRYGPAGKIEGSTRWWHGGKYPCESGGIWQALEAAARQRKG